MDEALAAMDALMLVTEIRSSLRRSVTSSSTYRPHGSDARGRFILGGFFLIAIVPPQRKQREITNELAEALFVEIGNRSAVPEFSEVTNQCIKFSRVRHT